MCAQYDIKTPAQELAASMDLSWQGGEWAPRVFPKQMAPVGAGKELRLMQFSLVPSWSKDGTVKYATYNARLDTILEKATWKKPFTARHCVVPIQSFIEPAYVGKMAGNMLSFSAPEVLWAAGIYDVWQDKATGKKLESFAIVTDDPSDFVKDLGHDRQPVFLSQERAREWIRNEGSKGEDLRTFLKEFAEEPNFQATIDRPLAKGWEKRIPKEGT